MRQAAREFLPQARKEHLVIKDVDDEVLVYDLERDKAHCLNSLAADLWRLCDGKTTTEGLVASFEKETGRRIDESFIWFGLEDLRRSHLLNDDLVWPEHRVAAKRLGISRREAVRRIGLGAVIALPLVISITAPTAAQTSSCGSRCHPCIQNSECCSGVCIANNPNCSGAAKKWASASSVKAVDSILSSNLNTPHMSAFL